MAGHSFATLLLLLLLRLWGRQVLLSRLLASDGLRGFLSNLLHLHDPLSQLTLSNLLHLCFIGTMSLLLLCKVLLVDGVLSHLVEVSASQDTPVQSTLLLFFQELSVELFDLSCANVGLDGSLRGLSLHVGRVGNGGSTSSLLLTFLQRPLVLGFDRGKESLLIISNRRLSSLLSSEGLCVEPVLLVLLLRCTLTKKFVDSLLVDIVIAVWVLLLLIPLLLTLLHLLVVRLSLGSTVRGSNVGRAVHGGHLQSGKVVLEGAHVVSTLHVGWGVAVAKAGDEDWRISSQLSSLLELSLLLKQSFLLLQKGRGALARLVWLCLSGAAGAQTGE